MPKKRKNKLQKTVEKRQKQLSGQISKTKKLIDKAGEIDADNKLLDRLFSQQKQLKNAEAEVLSKWFTRKSAPASSGAKSGDTERFMKREMAEDVFDRNSSRVRNPNRMSREIQLMDHSEPVWNLKKEFADSGKDKKRYNDFYYDQGYYDKSIGEPIRKKRFPDGAVGGSPRGFEVENKRLDRLVDLKEKAGIPFNPDKPSGMTVDDIAKRIKQKAEGKPVWDKHELSKIRQQIAIDFPSDGNAPPRLPSTSGINKFMRQLGIASMLSQASDVFQGKNIDDVILNYLPFLNEAEPINEGGKDEELRRLIEDPWSR